MTRCVTQLTDRIEKRKDRATAMVNEILALDKSIQGNVDQILNTLRGMTDSNDSRTQVAQTKRDMMERLGKVAQYYARMRAELEEQLRRTDAAVRDLGEALDKATNRLDQKIREIQQGLRSAELDPEKRKAMETELRHRRRSLSGRAQGKMEGRPIRKGCPG